MLMLDGQPYLDHELDNHPDCLRIQATIKQKIWGIEEEQDELRKELYDLETLNDKLNCQLENTIRAANGEIDRYKINYEDLKKEIERVRKHNRELGKIILEIN